MKTSARNVFEGKVSRLVSGAINDEVTVALKGGKEIVATITKGSTERLGIREGKDVLALVKASFVILLEDASDYMSSPPATCTPAKSPRSCAARWPWKSTWTATACP